MCYSPTYESRGTVTWSDRPEDTSLTRLAKVGKVLASKENKVRYGEPTLGPTTGLA